VQLLVSNGREMSAKLFTLMQQLIYLWPHFAQTKCVVRLSLKLAAKLQGIHHDAAQSVVVAIRRELVKGYSAKAAQHAK